MIVAPKHKKGLALLYKDVHNVFWIDFFCFLALLVQAQQQEQEVDFSSKVLAAVSSGPENPHLILTKNCWLSAVLFTTKVS